LQRTRTTPSPGPSSEPVRLSLAKREETSPGRSSSESPSASVTAVGAAGNAVGFSRGPSPLTLAANDVVPLAVAFQEICHACFRGADEAGCQVRLVGDMMVSSPAGVVAAVAAAGPAGAAPLQFRIRGAANLESVVPNKHLISQ